jgi:hypothetical protein
VSWGQDQAEADIVVAVRWIPAVAVRDAAIVRVIDPGAAAVHAVLTYGVFTHF